MAGLHVFHTVRIKAGWAVKEGGEVISVHRNQKTCWTAALATCRAAHRQGIPIKAVLHRKDGSVREERLYSRPSYFSGSTDDPDRPAAR